MIDDENEDEVAAVGAEFMSATLPEGCVPLGFIAVIAYLDEDGDEAVRTWNGYPDARSVTLAGLAELLKLDMVRRTLPQIYQESE